MWRALPLLLVMACDLGDLGTDDATRDRCLKQFGTFDGHIYVVGLDRQDAYDACLRNAPQVNADGGAVISR